MQQERDSLAHQLQIANDRLQITAGEPAAGEPTATSSRVRRKAELAKMECEYTQRRQRLALMEQQLQYAHSRTPMTVPPCAVSTAGDKEEESYPQDNMQGHGQHLPDAIGPSPTGACMTSSNTIVATNDAATTYGPICGAAEAVAGGNARASAATAGPPAATTTTADAATAQAAPDSPCIMIAHASTSPHTPRAVAAGTAPPPSLFLGPCHVVRH